MKNHFNKYKYAYFIVFIVLIIGIPLAIQRHWGVFYKLALWATPGNHGNWMSFWGSYLGIIASGIIAFSVAKLQIDNEKKENLKNNALKILPYASIYDYGNTPLFDNTQYNISIFVKFSAVNSSYPIRNVTAFLYVKEANSGNYMKPISVKKDDIFPNQPGHTKFSFTFPKENSDTGKLKMIILGLLIDGRIIKVEYENNKTTHSVKKNDKWEIYEQISPETFKNELQKL